MIRLIADRDVCVGSGMCVLRAPGLFDQDDDGRVLLVDGSPADEELARLAVSDCPSGALSLENDGERAGGRR